MGEVSGRLQSGASSDELRRMRRSNFFDERVSFDHNSASSLTARLGGEK
jgi:hypothetical protein